MEPNVNRPSEPIASAAAPAAAITPRERMLRALRGQPADRVPGWLMRQAGRYLPQYHEVRRNHNFLELCKTPTAAAEVSIQPVEAIGTDAIIIFNDIMLPLEHAGARVEFDERGPIVRNPVATDEDLRALAEREVTMGEPIVETIRETRRRVGPDFPILGFVGAPFTLATYWVEGRVGKQFAAIGKLRAGQPLLLEELLDRITRAVSDYLRIQIEAGADAVQIFDTWGSLLTQEEWGRFSAPYIRRVVEAVRPLGVPVILYVGGCAPYIDQMARVGADALSIDWRVSLGWARERIGGGIALQGNLDPTILLAGPGPTADAVERLFEKFPPGPGHVFNLGHGVLPTTPVESARALMEALKRHGAY